MTTGGASVFAPAKINLALHVTGRQENGYHLLDSLVVFADVGDRLHFSPADTLALQVMGPRAAGVPNGPDNLVLKAAALFGPGHGAEIVLEKQLPNAAGIGGGSADAAAALTGLAAFWDQPLPGPADILTLGADLPACLAACPTRMQGIGDVLDKVPPLPKMTCVLVTPDVALSTGTVFQGLETTEGAGLSDPEWSDFAGFIGWLCRQRNDLAAPARALTPKIDTALDALNARPGCALARMSGSGATCFGLFAEKTAAQEAAAKIGAAQPNWWVTAAQVL
ncbi:4-(cytidine 5'-diphospho)-2-C-methyl-D-erythritol kinase [Rhodophyticola sp. CCM32]|uniref:4-(cytidine 5'-diphospho)-2-C-methyl-D-erythritol kinase n=1 Tax=Rhodophyticola sp. CCM32 TaxID=2916397 RepID=UPI00107F3861|nr:4-(cytidine 5'-diphospho)-2-C-methyl-D-erythritol kinase [Rhodophyticola sp. CCM32]QBY02189.1 4-(cytidine 5'-diphospho)-2-C-methyl-D-erythritol kinase [Rhodophyticola sp. CCM32]